MWRERYINRIIKNFDDKLFCAKGAERKLCIYREGYRFDNFILDDGSVLRVSRPNPHEIFYLTRDWTAFSEPVEWSVDKILDKLRFGDLHHRNIVDELEKQYDKNQERAERDLDNNNEAFFKDARRAFMKDLKDVRVANMDKKRDLRRINEKKIKEK